MPTAHSWKPDLLEGHEAATIDLGAAFDGDLAATLVRRPYRHDAAVVYIHGFADYYFQVHMADAFDRAGLDLVAVDLRRHGRSLRPGNRRNFVASIDDFWPEVDAAIAEATRDHRRVVLLGHSTGGLVASIYAHRGPLRHSIDAVVLNSPWLDVKLPPLMRVAWEVAKRLGHLKPHLDVASGPSYYLESIHSSLRGEWDFDLAWKPPEGDPVQPGWVRAIGRAHSEVHRGLAIEVPVLVQHSDRSAPSDRWSPELLCADGVLDVGQIHRWAPALGPDVTIQTIVGGLHDLWLSPPDVRAQVQARTIEWVAGVLGA
ncbi:MAG: alpha/beta hydrolase [Acidimicrobiales bacterium]|nr:alpha/beta hydrolase [Acidimicrobiales bacterium]